LGKQKCKRAKILHGSNTLIFKSFCRMLVLESSLLPNLRVRIKMKGLF